METLITTLVIGSSIWVLIDAKALGAKKGQLKGVANMGAFSWFVVCLLLWIVGFPMYLAKRSEIKKVNEKEKGASIGVAIGIAIVCALVAYFLTIGQQGSAEEMIAESAIPVVTQIIQEQFLSDTVCVGVTVLDEPTENFYRATAFLDNGNSLEITIQHQGENIFVKILDQ